MAEMMTVEQYETIRKEMEPRRRFNKDLAKLGLRMRLLYCWCEEDVDSVSLEWDESHVYLVGECENRHPFRVLVD